MVVAGILGWILGHHLYIKFHSTILNLEIEDYLERYYWG